MKFTNNKVANNAMWIIGCKLAQSIAAIVISSLSARYLGPSNFGTINFAASITAFAVPIMQLGITDVLVQQIIDHPLEEGKILGSSLILCTSSAILSMLGIFAFISITSAGERETVLVVLLYSTCLLFQALETAGYWFQAKYLSKYTSLISFGAYLLVSAYKVFLLLTGKGIYWFALSNALDYMIIAGFQLYFYRKLGGQPLSLSWKTAKRILHAGKYYIVPNLMIVIFVNTDRIMLKYMLGAEATGLYSAAAGCAGIASFIFAAIINSFRPMIFEAVKISNKYFERQLLKLFRIIVILSLLQSIFMTCFPDFCIGILYGQKYSSSAPALRIIVWYTSFSYLGAGVGIWLLAKNQQRWLLLINAVGALSNILFNAILIPVIGICGAAVASLVTQAFTNMIVGLFIPSTRDGYCLAIKAFNPKGWIEEIASIFGKGKHSDPPDQLS